MSLEKVRALFNKGFRGTNASSFTKRDIKALRLCFQSSAENDVTG